MKVNSLRGALLLAAVLVSSGGCGDSSGAAKNVGQDGGQASAGGDGETGDGGGLGEAGSVDEGDGGVDARASGDANGDAGNGEDGSCSVTGEWSVTLEVPSGGGGVAGKYPGTWTLKSTGSAFEGTATWQNGARSTLSGTCLARAVHVDRIDTNTVFKAVLDGRLSDVETAMSGSGMNTAGDDAHFTWSAERM